MNGASVLAWIVGAGYVAGFLILTALAARRAGRSLWLFDAPGQALPAWGFRLVFVALVLAPALRLGWSESWLFPALAVVGAGGALMAQAYMGLSWRIGAATDQLGPLVKGGPFAWSRNPVFVGQSLLVWALVPTVGLPMLAAAVVHTLSVRR